MADFPIASSVTGLPAMSGPAHGVVMMFVDNNGNALPATGNSIAVSFTKASGAIAESGVFQTALAANTGRRGGVLQNTSSGTIRLFLGAGSAVESESFLLPPGASFGFVMGGAVTTDAIQVTSSSAGDTYALWWA